MLEKLKERVKNWMQKTGAETGLSKEFKDIFEVGGVPAFNQFYYFGIFIWKYLYKGFYSPWHRILAPTIENPRNRRNLERMDVAKAVSSELAGLIWSEQCEVHVSQSDSEEQPLEEFMSFLHPHGPIARYINVFLVYFLMDCSSKIPLSVLYFMVLASVYKEKPASSRIISMVFIVFSFVH